MFFNLFANMLNLNLCLQFFQHVMYSWLCNGLSFDKNKNQVYTGRKETRNRLELHTKSINIFFV